MEDVNYSLIPDHLLKQHFPHLEDGGKGEAIFLIQRGKKFNRFGIPQDRVVVLSSSAVYLFSNKKVHTKVYIRDLKYIIISL